MADCSIHTFSVRESDGNVKAFKLNNNWILLQELRDVKVKTTDTAEVSGRNKIKLRCKSNEKLEKLISKWCGNGKTGAQCLVRGWGWHLEMCTAVATAGRSVPAPAAGVSVHREHTQWWTHRYYYVFCGLFWTRQWTLRLGQELGPAPSYVCPALCSLYISVNLVCSTRTPTV